MPTQVGDDNATPPRGQYRRDFLIAMDVVRKPVEQEDGLTVPRSGFEVGHLQLARPDRPGLPQLGAQTGAWVRRGCARDQGTTGSRGNAAQGDPLRGAADDRASPLVDVFLHGIPPALAGST